MWLQGSEGEQVGSSREMRLQALSVSQSIVRIEHVASRFEK